MKKVLCNKDGKFLSVHDGDCILAELEDGNCPTHEDGNCPTHEDGTTVIYRESEEDPLPENIYFHAYHKNGGFFLPENNSSFYDHAGCGYGFSTKEERKRMDGILSENSLYHDGKEKCLKRLRCRAKTGNSCYYIDRNRFVTCKATEEENEPDNLRYNNPDCFRTREKAERKLSEVRAVPND